MAKDKDIHYNKKFKFDDSVSEYEFQIKKKRNWWWLLLLLLPFLLFIRCSHDVTVTTLDAETSAELEGVDVTLEYTSHFLYKDGRFFADIPVSVSGVTDSVGKVTLGPLPCSVYSYIFYCLSDEVITATGECNEAPAEEHLFHFTRNVTLMMPARRTDVRVTLVDKETSDPLPDATLFYSYDDNGSTVADSVRTDASGSAVVKNVRACSAINLLKGSCTGYADTTKTDCLVADLLANPDSAVLRLRPLKARFTFFVKNVETREPIPGAHAVVTLTDPRSGVTRGSVTTNVDGKGMGFYDEGFVLAKVAIHASKEHFKDSTLTGSYTVAEFLRLPDDDRTVWLRPLPYVAEFENVDSITGKPIAGVTNVITVTDPTGKTETFTEVSNRNGKFPVRAKEGSRIVIDSKRSPEYRDKHTEIPSFDKEEKVRMVPNRVSLRFRTIDADDGTLVPRCSLSIRGSRSGSHAPTSSGTGEFTVDGLLYGETISIVASHPDYETNDMSIRDDLVDDLLTAPQSERDIPMNMKTEPCSAGGSIKRVTGSPETMKKTYSMGMKSGTFVLDIDAYDWTDEFWVYDGKDESAPLLWHSQVTNKHVQSIRFNNYKVTIVARSLRGDSNWEYVANCP